MLAIEKQNIEDYVLSAMLIDHSVMDDCPLKPEHFGSVSNRILFKTMLDIHAKGLTIDPIILTKKLGNQVESVGGTDHIGSLYDYAPTAENLTVYIQEILKEYKISQSKKVAQEFINDPTEQGIEELSKELAGLTVDDIQEKSDMEVIDEIVDDLEHDKPMGITTGSSELNRMTGGLRKGNLIILSARSSVGKTAFSLDLSRKAAESGVSVDFFSLEMMKKEVIQRLLSAIGHIDMTKWKNPAKLMTQDDVSALMVACDRYMKINLKVHDMETPTVSQIRGRINQSLKENENQDHLVVIDYIKYIKASGKFERYSQEVGSIAEDLKMVARSLNIPIVLLVQINRGAEQRQDKRPMMSDLKDSGDIEQAADMIFLLYRDDYYNADTDKQNIAEINVAKNRNGPTGKVEMHFDKEHQRFLDIERNAKG